MEQMAGNDLDEVTDEVPPAVTRSTLDSTGHANSRVDFS